MNTIKSLFISFTFIASVFSASYAIASGIPVIDVANLAQAVEQVQAWQQQYQQMQQQINSMNGNRNMGGLLANENRSYLPPDWNSAMSLLNTNSGTSYGTLAQKAQQIQQANAILSTSEVNNLSPEVQQYINNARNASASQQALGQAAYENSAQRVGLLQTLTGQINTSTDPKAIMDLQARIQSEQASLANDQAQLQALTQLSNVSQQANAQKQTEMIIQSGGNGKGNFPSLYQ